jgi:transposase-like protein
MEKKFKSLSIFEFQEKFPDEASCLKYLSELKWKKGFECPKCSNKRYGKGQRKYIRKCTMCNHQVSPTSGTLFHKVKFPILKAFYIVYYVSTSKKGIASTELSRKLGLRQKTCWLFKRKVMEAMSSSGKNPLTERVEVDETVVGGNEKGVRGRKNKNKKIVVIGIEKKNKGVSRMYGKVINNSGSKEIKKFFSHYVDEKAIIKTDKWRGYNPLKKQYPRLAQKSSKGGKNFPELHRTIMNFKGWLRGMHHQVKHLQAYLNEYAYRFNRQLMKENIFDNLMERMVYNPPAPYSILKLIVN